MKYFDDTDKFLFKILLVALFGITILSLGIIIPDKDNPPQKYSYGDVVELIDGNIKIVRWCNSTTCKLWNTKSTVPVDFIKGKVSEELR